MKTPFTCDSFNLIYVVICDTCKEEYIRETGEGKTKDNQIVSSTHLRVCGNGEFWIFPLLQMPSKDTNLRQSYETRFQQKFKTKLNTL